MSDDLIVYHTPRCNTSRTALKPLADKALDTL